MRWVIVAAVAALSSLGAGASVSAGTVLQAPPADPAAALPLVPTPVQGPDPVMTVTVMPEGESAPVATVILGTSSASSPEPVVSLPPPPVPAPVAVLPAAMEVAEKIHPVHKVKVVKKKTIHKTLLSRTARQQMALLASKADDPNLVDIFNDHDVDLGIDSLDLHVFYGRPKLVKDDSRDDGDGDPEISEAVKLRLFLARMRALEAHGMARAAMDRDGDAALTDSVKLRLLMARQRAVEAHQKKFS